MAGHSDKPLAGVIGWPVAHSRSPRLHGHWLQRYGIAGYYVPLAVEPAHLPAVLSALPRMGFVGANVTIPHKEMVLSLADRISDRARRIGAANTLTFREGRLEADNTDGLGFIANLRDHRPDFDAGRGPVAVLGAGGAARAIIAALLDEGAMEIRLANRTRARAEALAQALDPKRIRVVDWERASDIFVDVALAVNTTSLGMEGAEPFDLTLPMLGPQVLATDLVYAPLITPFLARARQQAAQIVDGLGMLLHQAAPGFERWFGRRPVVDAALRAAVLAEE